MRRYFLSVEVFGHWRKWPCRVVVSKISWQWGHRRLWVNWIFPVRRWWCINLRLKRLFDFGRLLIMREWWTQLCCEKFWRFIYNYKWKMVWRLFFMRLESNIAMNFVVCVLIFDVYFERGWDHMDFDYEFGVRCYYLSGVLFSFASTVSSDSEVLMSWCPIMCWIENRLRMMLRISCSASFLFFCGFHDDRNPLQKPI